MTKVSPNTSPIVRYLLGRLPEDEQTRFEEQLLESEALFEALEEAESELIDEYVGDMLSADDRRRFELYFLTQPERRARVEFARALREAAVEHGREKRSRAVSAGQEIAAWWRRWVASLILQPQFAALAACCLIAIFGGLILALMDNSRLRQQLQQAQTERAETRQRSAAQLVAAESQLSNERSLRQRAEEALDHLNAGPKESGRPAIVSFVLSAFFRPVRGGESQPKLKSQQLLIPAAAKRVSLTFPVQVQSPDFTGYRISLRRADDPGQIEIWGRSGLRAVSKSGQRIRIPLQADLLIKGEYQLKLSGVLSDNNAEPIGEYRFTVARD
jgi:anti-sigma factor RsiW